MPHVEKRIQAGTLSWRARYRSPDGQERSKTFARKIDAEQFLAQVEVDKARNSWVDPSLGKVPFGEWSERWLRTTTHLKPKTRSGYESMLRARLLPAFQSVAISDIRPTSESGCPPCRAAASAPRAVVRRITCSA